VTAHPPAPRRGRSVWHAIGRALTRPFSPSAHGRIRRKLGRAVGRAVGRSHTWLLAGLALAPGLVVGGDGHGPSGEVGVVAVEVEGTLGRWPTA
jgi:hypothetical protein